jgi:hypothetical protein
VTTGEENWAASDPTAPGRSDSVERSRRLILLSGTAGTGKRTVAAFLAAEHAFWHLDLSGLLPAQIDQGQAAVQVTQKLGESTEDVIVTCPAATGSLISALESHGFEWIWFDSDRGTAKPLSPLADRNACASGGRSVPRFVETFEADGSFRPLVDIAAELLTVRPLPALRPNR